MDINSSVSKMPKLLDFSLTPMDPRHATKFSVEILLYKILPLIRNIYRNLKSEELQLEDSVLRAKSLFSLCSNQVKKCIINLFDILKIEYREQIYLKETRQYIFQRLSWCVDRLVNIDQCLIKLKTAADVSKAKLLDDSMFETPMYFVNWIDESIDIVMKLAELVCQVGNQDDEGKNEIIEQLSNLNISLEELLTGAITLSKYFLVNDEHIVKARCEVVLRELLALKKELIVCDGSNINDIQTLKSPILPSCVDMQSLVLKDAIYALEKSTNAALLTLIVYCFSYSISPVDALREHCETTACICQDGEDCNYVKEFDLFNEKLLQIGLFAISCSSDEKRVLRLRSGLASLESLESRLVPALATPHRGASAHAAFLARAWATDHTLVRDTVFLIVDPAAFVQAVKEIMHGLICEIRISEEIYDNKLVCKFINIGGVVYDFLSVYDRCEPEALNNLMEVKVLWTELQKVISECKAVSNLLCVEGDFVYDMNLPCKPKKESSMKDLIKRLILLYSKIKEINCLLSPKNKDDQFFGDESEKRNATYTYSKDLSKCTKNNATRSFLARNSKLNETGNRFPLFKFVQQLKIHQNNKLSFPQDIDDLMNSKRNKTAGKSKDVSILYKFSPRKNKSVLPVSSSGFIGEYSRRPHNMVKDMFNKDFNRDSTRESLFDDATSLQITEILDQMSVMAQMTPKRKSVKLDTFNESSTCNFDTAAAHLYEMAGGELDCPPSDVSSIERLHDLVLIESKITCLKTSKQETSL